MKNDLYLDQELKKYGQSDIYPFHMPGHKRQTMGMEHPEKIDITEVEGFDNLHHAEGILDKEQLRMARVFGADHSFFLVNGSTSGLLGAISAAVPAGGKILIARNCHKAVYNAIYLRGLSVEYLYPMQTGWGIQGSIDPTQVRQKLEEDPQIQAVLLTSPTYDGVVSNIEAISQIVHEYQIPLIVDEAHGAHFGFSNGFPQKALALGADVVIESMHKTLPAYTQSAAIHVKGNRVSIEKLQRFLAIYQSSSPSYLLMAGLSHCTQLMEQQGQEMMERFEKQLEAFYQSCQDLQCLQVFPLWRSQEHKDALGQSGVWENIYGKDNSKVLIFCQNASMSGQQLAQRLLEQYGLQMEMDSGHYVTALTSLMDTKEGFERLVEALHEIDKGIPSNCHELEEPSKVFDWQQCIQKLYLPKEKQMEITQAMECDTKAMLFSQAAGRMSAEFAYLYPPGIPFLTPGEIIPEYLVEIVETLQREGFEIQGLSDLEGKWIKVASF